MSKSLIYVAMFSPNRPSFSATNSRVNWFLVNLSIPQPSVQESWRVSLIEIVKPSSESHKEISVAAEVTAVN